MRLHFNEWCELIQMGNGVLYDASELCPIRPWTVCIYLLHAVIFSVYVV